MIRIPTNGPPTHPGEMLLEEFLKPLGISQVDLAAKLAVSYVRINELIHGKRGITPDPGRVGQGTHFCHRNPAYANNCFKTLPL